MHLQRVPIAELEFLFAADFGWRRITGEPESGECEIQLPLQDGRCVDVATRDEIGIGHGQGDPFAVAIAAPPLDDVESLSQLDDGLKELGCLHG